MRPVKFLPIVYGDIAQVNMLLQSKCIKNGNVDADSVLRLLHFSHVSHVHVFCVARVFIITCDIVVLIVKTMQP